MLSTYLILWLILGIMGIFVALAMVRIISYLVGIRKWKRLLEEGKITEAEYYQAKDRLLGKR